MFSDFESFKSKLEVKTKEITEPLERLRLRIKILKEFYPNSNEIIHRMLSRAFFEYPKALQSGLLDQKCEEFDLLCMDGLMSATMSGNFDQVRVSKFSNLANIDWELAIERLSLGHFDTKNPNDISFFHLANVLHTRLHLTQKCSAFKEEYPRDGWTPEDFLKFVERRDNERLKEDPGSYQKQRNQILLSLREGLRWLELKELMGGEEIYLLDNPLDSLKSIDILPRFDIPRILKDGDDEPFDQLKKLLLSSQGWVRETCVQLRGVVGWIREATIARNSDKDTAANLSRLIQQKVKSTFGDHTLEEHLTKPRFMRKLSLISRAKRNERGGVIRDEYTPSDEDNDDEVEDKDKTASLIKSIQSLLRGSPNASSQAIIP